jgi:hypothetical protein
MSITQAVVVHIPTSARHRRAEDGRGRRVHSTHRQQGQQSKQGVVLTRADAANPTRLQLEQASAFQPVFQWYSLPPTALRAAHRFLLFAAFMRTCTLLSSRSGPDRVVPVKSSNDNDLDRIDLRPGAALRCGIPTQLRAARQHPCVRWQCVNTRCSGAALLRARRTRESARLLIRMDLRDPLIAHKSCIIPAATAVHQCDHTRLCNWHGESG